MSQDPSRRFAEARRRAQILYGDACALEPLDEQPDHIAVRVAGGCIVPQSGSVSVQSSFIKKFMDVYSADLKTMSNAKPMEAEVAEIEKDGTVVLDLSTGTGVLEKGESALSKVSVGRRIWVSLLSDTSKTKGSGHGRIVCSLKLAAGRRSLTRIESLWAGGIWIDAQLIEFWQPDGWIADIDGVKAALPAEEVGEADVPLNVPLRFSILHYDPSTFSVILSRKKHVETDRRRRHRRIVDRLHPGDIVTGRIASVTPTCAWVDVGGAPAELTGEDAGFGPARENLLEFHPGQQVDVMVLDVSADKISVGLRQLTPDPWVFIKRAIQPGSRLAGQVRKILADRILIDLPDGVLGEIPWKDAGWQVNDASDLAQFFAVGGRVECVCQSVQREQGKLLLSIRAVRSDPLPDIVRRYPAGTRAEVRIVSCNPSRALVATADDFFGEIPAEEIAWSGPISPVQFFSWQAQSSASPPRKVPVESISVDPATRLIRFGIKQLKPDPFVLLVKEIEAGKIYEGRAVKNIAVGTLVELRKGLVGLLRKSDYGGDEQPPVEGHTIRVMVLNIQPQQRRILLSRRSVLEMEDRQEIQPYLANPQEERKVRMKDVIQGDVFKKFFEKK